MASPTEAEILAAAKAIIDSGASSYSIGNRSVSKLDPLRLYELSQKIAADADRASSGVFRLAKFVRPKP